MGSTLSEKSPIANQRADADAGRACQRPLDCARGSRTTPSVIVSPEAGRLRRARRAPAARVARLRRPL